MIGPDPPDLVDICIPVTAAASDPSSFTSIFVLCKILDTAKDSLDILDRSADAILNMSKTPRSLKIGISGVLNPNLFYFANQGEDLHN